MSFNLQAASGHGDDRRRGHGPCRLQLLASAKFALDHAECP